MKTTSAILAALWVSTCSTNAPTISSSRSASSVNPIQTAPSDTPYAVTERGASHRVWQRTTYETTPDGRQIPHIHKYTELATGLNFWNSTTGQWQESQELIESFPGGAIARQGQHQVIFANNLATVGAIDLQTPDGRRMRSHVLGLSYFDTASGQSVLIAEVKDSQGQLYPPNVVIYPDAFTDFKADVRYTYTRAGFEQDILLHARPPGPEAYGLNPATTRLQVLTEFLNPPQPVKKQMSWKTRQGEALDEVLDFGTMQMGQGKTFSLERGGGDIPVSKQWLRLEGRDFLVEEVAVPDIDEELRALPAAEGASLNPAAGSVLHVVSKQRLLPAMPLAQAGTNEMQLARLSLPCQGLVLDYQILNSGSTNYTFQGDTTYYISGPVILYRTATFEGGAVLKYGSSGALNPMSLYPLNYAVLSVNWQATAYRPVIFTSMNDNSVGETIANSTGNPSTYLGPALTFFGSFPTLANFRIAYAQEAIECNNGSLSIYNAQFVNCGIGIIGGAVSVNLRNVLFANIGTVFSDSYVMNINAQNVTFSGSACLGKITGYPRASYLWLTNCILASVTTLTNGPFSLSGNYNGFYNAPQFGANPVTNNFYPFQSVGAGNYYLTNGCGFQNVGTTNIDPALLAGLRTKTVYPPLVASGTAISSTQALTLGPWVPRDTNGTPSLGYHYDPLDYLWSQVSIGPPLTLTNGVAIGLFGTLGFTVTGGGLNSQGRADAMNRLVWYPSVQEQPVRLSNVSTVGSALFTGLSGSTPKLITLRFTDVPMLGSRQLFFDQCYSYSGPIVNVRDSWLRGINLTVNRYFTTGWLGSGVTLQNCLLERSTVSLSAGYVDYYYANNQMIVVQNPLSVSLFNNLFWHSSLGLANLNLKTVSPYYSYMQVRDNLFDTSTFTFGGDGNYTNYMRVSNNGYNQTTDGFPGPNDLTIANLTYATSWLGPWYIGSSSPTVLDMGSRSAASAGLYYYTIQSSQMPDGANTVSIGYHYVAVAGNGNPIDTDGDGIPDYLEDANGNGLADPGETSWINADTDRDGIPDGWELVYGLNSLNPADALRDPDYDGRNNVQEFQDGTDLFNPNGVLAVRLGYWRFDNTNTWAGDAGQLPLVVTNIVGIPSWNTNAVLIDSAKAAILKYRDVETNGNANINLRNGTIRFWFKPDWSSTTVGGAGPQSEGRLIEMGAKGSTNGWWGLLVNSTGTNIYFGTQTNSTSTLTTNLTAAISWTSNIWHQVVLTYTPANSSLYLDGQPVVTSGTGTVCYPNAAGRAAGLRIGSDVNGNNQAGGVFDELETFNYPLSTSDVIDGDHDGLSDSWEVDYFGGLNQMAGGDYDGDGVNNFQEYLYGIDPNKINFSLSVPNQLVATNIVNVTITILGGVPSNIAALADRTNFAAATWSAYTSSNVTINIGTNQGLHDVWVGLRGRLATSQQTWQKTTLILDSVSPMISITNPVNNISFNASRVNVLGNFKADSLKRITVNGVLAFVSGTNFDALNVPLAARTNKITAVIEKLNGATNTASINIIATTNANGSLNNPIQLQATPVRGLAPLQVTLQIQSNNVPGNIQHIFYDFDGDNVMDQSANGLNSITHTYTAYGEYFPVVTVQTKIGSGASATYAWFSSSGGWNSTNFNRLKIRAIQPGITNIVFPSPAVNTNTFNLTFQGYPQVTVSIQVNGANSNNATGQTNYADLDTGLIQVPVNLGTNDGIYYVSVGILNGTSYNWTTTKIVLDTVPPQIVPVGYSVTTNLPLLQLKGYATETLSAIAFDLVNSQTTNLNQMGFVVASDGNTFSRMASTNGFQCFDIKLAPGLNTVNLRCTDLAGNVSTNVYFYTLNTNAMTTPTLSVDWPSNNTVVSGNKVTVKGHVSDPTATVVAHVAQNGSTNDISGVVERDGTFWIDNVPLSSVTNLVRLTATNVAGHSTTNMITVQTSPVTITVDPISGDALKGSTATVTGTIDSGGYTVTVNGVSAGVWTNTDGSIRWQATNVPVPAGGVATFHVQAIQGNTNLKLLAPADKPIFIRVSHYKESLNYRRLFHWVLCGSFPWTTDELYFDNTISRSRNWTNGVGGSGSSDFYLIDSYFWSFERIGPCHTEWQWPPEQWPPTPPDASVTTSCDNDGLGSFDMNEEMFLGDRLRRIATYAPTIPWEHMDYGDYPAIILDGCGALHFFQHTSQTRLELVVGGLAVPGPTRVVLKVTASAFSNPSGWVYGYGRCYPQVGYLFSGDKTITPANIKIAGMTCVDSGDGTNGFVTVTVPAGVETLDITPVAQTSSYDCYSFDVTNINFAMAVDANRDGQVNLDRSDATTAGNPYRFWINDSQEGGDISSAADDIPGSSSPNYNGDHANGRSDLVNFFPVALCLSNTLQLFPTTKGYEYHLSQADGAVKFIYTALAHTNAFDYLTNLDSYEYGTYFNERAITAYAMLVTPEGVTLHTTFLDLILVDGNKGVILVEGTKTTQKPLMLEIWRNGKLLAGVPLYLKLDGIEKMYRHINLRDGPDAPPTSTPNLSGLIGQKKSGDWARASQKEDCPAFPDSLSNDKWLVFVHGYNVSGQEARGWESEMFKRFYWSHNQARFVGVAWFGDPYGGDDDFLADYHWAVMNAFATATKFSEKIGTLIGPKTIVSHSLGGCVVSSAIQDYGLVVDHFCMVDGAITMEAFKGDIPPDLRDLAITPWVGADGSTTPSYPSSLWASEWHSLFPASDHRSGLTWRDRFVNAVPVIHNFYSSTEDVLAPYVGTPPSTIISILLSHPGMVTGRYAWEVQEKTKGRKLDLGVIEHVRGGSDYGGWCFNIKDPLLPDDPVYYDFMNFLDVYRTNKTASAISSMLNFGTINNNILRRHPLFEPGWGVVGLGDRLVDVDTAHFCGPTWIMGLYTTSGGNTIAADPAKRAQLLAQAIPALTLPTGANRNSAFINARNYNMPMQFADAAHWPSARGINLSSGVPNWLHSDMLDVAYPYIHKLFEQITTVSQTNP